MTMVLSNHAAKPIGQSVPHVIGRVTAPQYDFDCGVQVTRRRAQVMTSCSDRFGQIGAELFRCWSNEYNELQIYANTHILLMRYAGVATRCDIAWPEHGDSKRLSELRENSILFNPARSSMRVSKRDNGCYAYIALQILPCALELLHDGGPDYSVVSLRPQAGTGQSELCKIMLAMRNEIEMPGPAGELYKETLALQLLIRLVRCGSDLAVARAKGGLAAWQLRRTLELMESDLSAAPSLTELASKVGLSATHFCTAFKQSTGLPPHRYLLNRRITRAKELMRTSKLNLTEIALESGFSSSSQFAIAFRRIEGLTPTEFRRSA